MKKIYICRDDRTEMLSAIYDAWKENRNKEVGIGLLGKTQQQLFCEYAETFPGQVERLNDLVWDMRESYDEAGANLVHEVIQAAKAQ